MRELGKVMVTVVAAAQAVVMLAVEFNRTHATNPKWPGHARFHLVWQNLTTALLSTFAIALIWWPSQLQEEHFFLAAALVFLPLVGFGAAYLARPLYNGLMSDSNGVPSLQFFLAGRWWKLDGNTVAVAFAAIALVAAVVMALLSR